MSETPHRVPTTAYPGSGQALRFAPTLAAGLLYALLTLLFLHPDPRAFNATIAPDLGDPVFNLTILKWGAAQWSAGLPDFWNAPFFFPAQGTITLSDHLLGPAAIVALLSLVGCDPVSAYNWLFLSSFALSGLATFWVLRRSELSWSAAFAGGLIFAFSPFRLEQRPHLQVLLAQFMPLVLYFWGRLLAERSFKAGLLFFAVYAGHVSGGNYLAYMIHLPLLAIAWVRWGEHGSQLFEPRGLRRLAWIGAACGTLLLVIFLPYFSAAPEFASGRQPEDWRAYGATLLSFFIPSPSNFTFPPQAWRWLRPENTLSAGFLPTLLALGGLLWLWRSRRPSPQRALTGGRKGVLASLFGIALVACAVADLRTLARGGRHAWMVAFFETWTYLRLFVLVALALGVAGWLWRRWGGRVGLILLGRNPWERGLLAAGGLSLLLCWPIFFVPLARLLPGLDRMRVPTRFYAFASLALAFLAALALDRLRERLPNRRGFTTIAVLVGLLVLELAPRPMTWWRLETAETLDPVYRWLAAQTDVQAVVEIPAGDVISDIGAMYAQSFHGKPLVNGYSGFLPPDYLDFVACCGPGVPTDATLDRLRSLGVTHLVVWPPRRWKEDKRRELARLGERPGVRRAFRRVRGRGEVWVFRLEEVRQ